jgi:hypothetical protein
MNRPLSRVCLLRYAVALVLAAAMPAAFAACSSSSARDEYQMTRSIRIAPTTPTSATETTVAAQPSERDEPGI